VIPPGAAVATARGQRLVLITNRKKCRSPFATGLRIFLWRCPKLRATNAPEVNPVEEHAELDRINRDPSRRAFNTWNLESTLLESFVHENKTAARPKEALYSVPTFAHKHENAAGKRVELPLVTYDGTESVVTTTHVNAACSQNHLDVSRER